MSAPIENGTLAKITHDSTGKWEGDSYKAGRLIEIEDYIDANEAEDGIAFYWASSHGTGNMNDVTVDARHVEVVRTADQMTARRIPTMEELRDFLGSALLDEGDTFEVTETDRDGPGVEIAGKTHDGLRFAATIQITSIYEADF